MSSLKNIKVDVLFNNLIQFSSHKVYEVLKFDLVTIALHL